MWKNGGERSASGPFLFGKSPQYPLYKKLGGPQSRFGKCGMENNILPLPAIELCRPAHRSLLYQLSYPDFVSKKQYLKKKGLVCELIGINLSRDIHIHISLTVPRDLESVIVYDNRIVCCKMQGQYPVTDRSRYLRGPCIAHTRIQRKQLYTAVVLEGMLLLPSMWYMQSLQISIPKLRSNLPIFDLHIFYLTSKLVPRNKS
jgi:hypothetical protein